MVQTSLELGATQENLRVTPSCVIFPCRRISDRNCHLDPENIYLQDYQEEGCHDGSALDMALDRSFLCSLSDSGALDGLHTEVQCVELV